MSKVKIQQPTMLLNLPATTEIIGCSYGSFTRDFRKSQISCFFLMSRVNVSTIIGNELVVNQKDNYKIA